MENQADFATTPVTTAFTPAVPSPGIKAFSKNHVPDPVDLRGDDKRIVVLALPAPKNPVPGPFCAKRQRRTFWTACASCKKKSKHPIEYINCNIPCNHCSEKFKATEVSRPRNQSKTTTENAYSRAIVTSPGTMAEPSKMTPTGEAPPRKKVKREMNARHAAGKHGDNLQDSFDEREIYTITETISKDEIKMLLVSKGRNMVTEATIKGNKMKKIKV